MRARRLVPGTVTVAVAATLGVLGLAAGPAAGATTSRAGSPQPVSHSNVGAAHSPQVQHQLAGPAGTTTPVINGAMAAATTGPVNGAPEGVDVASYQHPNGAPINWGQVYTDGIRFAAVKATEGAYYQNPYALSDLSAAKTAGLSTVAYAFAIPNGNGSSASPVTQADYLLSYLGADASTVPIMLDIEYNPYGAECYGLSQSAMVSWITGFDNEIKAKTGQLPIIYTPPSWWNTCTGSSTIFGQTPVWIPYYNSTATSPPLPAGWSNWNFWQYGQGTVNGIPGTTTDLDQLDPSIVTLLNPGIQHDPAGSAIATVPVTPFTVSPAPALTYSATNLPAGLSIDSGTGAITGTPSQTGSSSVTVTATDGSVSGSVSFTWDVYGTITVSQPANRSTVAGTPVYLQMQATDSASGYTPSFTASGLPPGLSISSSGLITGWPYKPGTYTTTVRAADSLGAAGTATFTWTVSAAATSGPAGPVRLDLAGKCLNDVGNSSANGTAMDIWTCNGSSSQHWTVVKDQTLRIHGKCLDVYHGGTASGTKVDLYSCNGTVAQQWRVQTGGELVNPHSGKCLTDPSGSTANGTRIKIETCAGKNYQKWRLPAGPVVWQIPGKCLDDYYNRTTNGNKIDIWTCNGKASQAWTVYPDDTIRIHGKCLDDYHGGTAAGNWIDLYTCNGTSAQKWYIVPSGAGVALVNVRSGRRLTISGTSSANGTRAVLGSTAVTPRQTWRVQ